MTELGRLFRFTDGVWRAIGEPLAPFDHAPPDPSLPLAPWVLPRDPEPTQGDVVVVNEQAHQLLAELGPDDQAVQNLWQQTTLFFPPDEAAAWFGGVTVWLGQRLTPDRPWPEPQR